MEVEAELTLSAILDDYLEKLWVFVVKPPRPPDIEPCIDFITSIDWEEEVSFLRSAKDIYFAR